MYLKVLQISSIAIIAAGLALPISNAAAEDTFTADREEIERLCEEADGRFEAPWAYDDKSVQYGRQWTCEAAEIKITCQGGVCRFATVPDEEASS